MVSHNLNLKEVLAIEDIDQRTQAMRYVPVRDFLKHAKSKCIDEYEQQGVKYELHEIPSSDDLFTETAYYAVYNCPSTNKMYMS